jgi:hypothetical protein
MQATVSQELGEHAQRHIALAFTAMLAVAGTALLMLAPTLIVGAREGVPYYKSPTFFPMAGLSLLVLGAVFHGLRLLRGGSLETDDIDEPAANWRMVLVSGAAYAGYIAIVPLVGYAAGTAAFLLGLGVLARLGWKLPVAICVVLTAVLFAVFVLGLNVWFPAPELAGGR